MGRTLGAKETFKESETAQEIVNAIWHTRDTAVVKTLLFYVQGGMPFYVQWYLSETKN